MYSILDSGSASVGLEVDARLGAKNFLTEKESLWVN